MVNGGGGCFAGLVTSVVLAVAIIGGILYGAGELIGHIQANLSLPVHDSLRNIQIQGGRSDNLYSDSDGLHMTDTNYYYSGLKYGDVDVSISAKLMNYASPDNPAALAAYGIAVRQGGYGGQYLFFGITPNGRWFNGYPNQTDPTQTGTPNSALRTGIGATNTLEVQTHGTHFVFLINGVSVDDEDMSGASSEGTIEFEARNFEGDPPATITVVFT